MRPRWRQLLATSRTARSGVSLRALSRRLLRIGGARCLGLFENRQMLEDVLVLARRAASGFDVATLDRIDDLAMAVGQFHEAVAGGHQGHRRPGFNAERLPDRI